MLKFNRHIQISLGFFFTATFLGLLLRYVAVSPINITFRYIVHAHSHVAFIGWIYLALITMITKFFFASSIPPKKYNFILYLTLISIVGMLVTFPFQGYALFSIIFSTLFLFASYFYAWAFFKYTPAEEKKSTSYRVIKYAILYMVLSSIGPWGIGAIMSTLGPTSPLYHSSIYFYLHFQYNAWMVLAIIGIVLKILEKNAIPIEEFLFKKFLISFNIGVVVTFLISILFTEPNRIIYILSIVGSLIQIASFIYLFHSLKDAFLKAKVFLSSLVYTILFWGFLLCFTKLFMQLAGSFPDIAALIVKYKFLTIGFIHWVTLGVVSIPLLGLLKHLKLIQLNTFHIQWFVGGYILTELLIFYKPASVLFHLPKIPSQNYNLYLFIVSALLVGAIASILITQFLKKKNSISSTEQITKK